MFYFLSKTIDFLLMPFEFSLILLLFAWFAKKKVLKRVSFFCALLILILISNSVFVMSAFNLWEYKPKSISQAKAYDVGVVLTGGQVNWSAGEMDYVGFGTHSDRFFKAYLLYTNKKIKKILVTGASPKWLVQRGKSEGREVQKMLVLWGVKPEDIILESNSKNTRENARFTKQLLDKQFPGQRYLIITSSFHMRRSMACFKKAGIVADPFPTDFYGGDFSFRWRDIFIPAPEMVGIFTLLWREVMGMIIYKAMGYC